MNDQNSNKPKQTLRDGMLKATIWENQGEQGLFHTATLSKIFEKDGKLKDGHSFAGGDLLRIAELAKEAYHRIRRYRAEESTSADTVSEAEQYPAEMSP